MEMEFSACFTGHRTVEAGQVPLVRERLEKIIRFLYDHREIRFFICGGALGFDTLAAQAVLAFRRTHPQARLILAIPCPEQAARWRLKDQQEYNRILAEADERVLVSPQYVTGCMLRRNRWMVDHASVCVCYMRAAGSGTGYTVRYALEQHRELVNLAMPALLEPIRMKEPLEWNCTFTSLSAGKNARTVPFRPFPAGRIHLKRILKP